MLGRRGAGFKKIRNVRGPCGRCGGAASPWPRRRAPLCGNAETNAAFTRDVITFATARWSRRAHRRLWSERVSGNLPNLPMRSWHTWMWNGSDARLFDRVSQLHHGAAEALHNQATLQQTASAQLPGVAAWRAKRSCPRQSSIVVMMRTCVPNGY